MARYNDAFIKILGELYDIMVRKGEPFRAKAYQKAQETVMGFPEDITDDYYQQLKGLPGIGDTIMSKLAEYVKTGILATIEKEKNNPINILTHIYGIGPKKATNLVEAGITSIDALRLSVVKDPKLLTTAQKAGLKYYNDIQQRIPRSEIDEFKTAFSKIFESVVSTGSSFEIVGSYRRGAIDSGDIDIIITNKNDDTTIFDKVLDVLIKDKIIVEQLSRGKTKSLTIIKTLPGNTPLRRVDFLYTAPDEYAFAILYFTGSKVFNTVVRQRALNLGYTLNEHSLSHFKDGVKGSKVDHMFPDERSILEFLGIQYKMPVERIDGRSVTSLIIDKSEAIDKSEVTDKSEAIDKIEPKLPKKNIVIKIPKNKTFKKAIGISTMDLITQFKDDGISALKLRTEKELSEMLKLANEQYYCDENSSSGSGSGSGSSSGSSSGSVLSDNLYDILREYTLSKYPENKVANEGHASCDIEVTKNKVKLPYELWSMDKIKPTTDAVSKWTKTYKGPYVVSAKLDGISALFTIDKSGTKRLYTRGNGTVGQDISHLIPYLIRDSLLNTATATATTIAIRGEIIIKKTTFASKYNNEFKNPRNFVAGVVNKKTVDPAVVKDLDFVVYEVISPQLAPSAQLEFLDIVFSKNPATVVKNWIIDKISNEILSERLLEWRAQYEYEIDGIIVVNDAVYPRPVKNPEYAFAFKMVMGDQIAEVKVVDIIWTPSKDGYLKPRVQIEPIFLGGVMIEYATGFNAKFIDENRIGIGAVISIIRSGDVIPHIIGTIVPAEQLKWPSQEYVWNDTYVDIMLKDKTEDATVIEKNIAGFFKGIEVDGLGPGNIKKMIASGFNSVPKIIAMSKADLLTVDGFKEKTATKLHNGIKTRILKASVVDLMTASNIFGRGFGELRFTEIFKIQPDILVSPDSDKEKIRLLVKIDGIGEKTAKQFVKKIAEFMEFLDMAGLSAKLGQHEQQMEVNEMFFGHPLSGKRFVLTGFRDKALVDKIKGFGGIEASAVSKTTDIVLVKDADAERDTGKAALATKLGIPIMTKAEFIAQYGETPLAP